MKSEKRDRDAFVEFENNTQWIPKGEFYLTSAVMDRMHLLRTPDLKIPFNHS